MLHTTTQLFIYTYKYVQHIVTLIKYLYNSLQFLTLHIIMTITFYNTFGKHYKLQFSNVMNVIICKSLQEMRHFPITCLCEMKLLFPQKKGEDLNGSICIQKLPLSQRKLPYKARKKSRHKKCALK